MKKFNTLITVFALSSTVITGAFCAPADIPKEATEYTRTKNQEFVKKLNFEDKQDFADAQKGFIAPMAMPVTKEDGSVIWSINSFEFLKSDKVPDSVNPSLWRQAQLNLNNGLFKVADGIYQIRGFDLANMTIMETDNGIIIIDPLTSIEVSKAGLELYYEKVEQPKSGKRPIKAVVYTHSHIDHFGGVRGVIDEKDVKSGKIKVIVPEGFLNAAISENIFAGNAMLRRAVYMYGVMLPKNARGHVDSGLGKTNSLGNFSLIPPTDIIRKTGEKMKIDGLEIEYMMANNTEAPSEMMMYFPQKKAFCAAEVANANLHNLYTIRGAQVRDANNWWKVLDEALYRYGTKSDVLFGQHHWPKWGTEKIEHFLGVQRDGYKFIHDQTLHMANMGYTSNEIAEKLQFPETLFKEWSLRDYYGTINHNAKAVYQRYLGWYDGNPANLNPLPPEDVAKKYVEYMGGEDAVMKKAKKSFAKGEYRWVSEVMKHVVFADPTNQAAKNLLADSLEQQGYQSESGTWRPAFLTAAKELRNGRLPTPVKTTSQDLVQAMSPHLVLEYMGIAMNAERANGKKMTINWNVAGTKQKYVLMLENSVLIYRENQQAKDADLTITMPKMHFVGLAFGAATVDQVIMDKENVKVSDVEKLKELFSLIDQFSPNFNIVTP